MATDWGGIISTAIGGTSAVATNLFGKDMVKEAEKREAALGDAPKFKTPQSQAEYEALMKSQAGQDMPGYSDMLNQLEAQTGYQAAAGARAAGSQYGALSAGNAAQANRRKYTRSLSAGNEMYKSNADLAAIQAGASRTQYDIMEYEYNENIPWQIAKNEIAAIRGVGQQKIMSGLDRVGAAGIYGAQIYGNRTPQPQTDTTSMLPTPYNYGAAGVGINQMGQNQLTPGYNQQGYTEPWMTQQWNQ